MLVSETSYFTAVLYTHSDLWDDDSLCKKKASAQKGMRRYLLGRLSKNTVHGSVIRTVDMAAPPAPAGLMESDFQLVFLEGRTPSNPSPVILEPAAHLTLKGVIAWKILRSCKFCENR